MARILHTEEVVDIMEAVFPTLLEQLVVDGSVRSIHKCLQLLDVLFGEFKGSFGDVRFGERDLIGLAFFGVWLERDWEGWKVRFLEFLKIVGLAHKYIY